MGIDSATATDFSDKNLSQIKEQAIVKNDQFKSSHTIPTSTMPDSKLSQQQSEKTFDAAWQLIHRSYQTSLKNCKALLPSKNTELHKADTALFKLERLVTENKQTILESATAAYTTLGAAGYVVFFLLDSDGQHTDFYIGARGVPQEKNAGSVVRLLEKTFNGHFPGSQLTRVASGDDIQKKLNFVEKIEKAPATAVTTVTGIPSLSIKEREYFTQGLEKFLDAAQGEEYTALILAEPVSPSDLNQARSAFESTATHLSPLLKQQVSYGVNESEAIGLSLTEGVSRSLAESVGQTITNGSSFTKNYSETQGETYTVGKNSSLSKTPLLLANFRGSKTKGQSTSNATSRSKTSGYSTGTNESLANTNNYTNTLTGNESTTDSTTATIGSSQQLTLEQTNKSIEQLLKRIDQHLDRLDEARSYGGWQTAAYFISKTTESAEALGSTFMGLMRGDTSGAEDSTLITWNKDSGLVRNHVLNWLRNLTHPRFNPDFIKHLSLDYITPAVLLSGRELAIQLGLPRRSTSSVTVLEVPAFGRSIRLLDLDKSNDVSIDNKILLGNIRHLWHDTKQQLHLALDKLCYHTLITGTTGVGKTTVIMSLLAQSHKKNIPFLVIEPAKGEYRKLLSLATPEKPVTYRVAGRTGPDALRINPMVFPKGIELTDHIDRICTVFNAAFPMYAAMPQVLEEAIFTAYEELGWDSINSYCAGGERHFPTLRRVADLIPQVVKELGYSEQLSSDYIGALSTRLRSLCRGSLGMTLLCSELEETTSQELFEQSAIVDLSPMGSPEKRALLMGILFMRMYEKRIAEGLPNEAALRHLMVLEEAHVLLKKTATDQSQEGSNPRGLAVEAFSNALAEMRAYGQGFIVADQSASALDDAVLRNTNTKIVMRAPFEADRLALGGALALNEEQTQQLARLENQTAIIHQSNWLEPVLCRIQQEKIPEYLESESSFNNISEEIKAKKSLVLALWRNQLSDLVEEKLSFTEDQINQLIAVIKIKDDIAQPLKKAILSDGYISDKELMDFIYIIIPMLKDSALVSMVTSRKGLENSIGNILEMNLGIFNHVNKVIRKDVVRFLEEGSQ